MNQIQSVRDDPVDCLTLKVGLVYRGIVTDGSNMRKRINL